MTDCPFESNLKLLYDLVENDEPIADDYSHSLHETLMESTERYCSSELIAEGGMKRVSKVFDSNTGRYVAMATLRNATQQEEYEPFLREAYLTALLDHPNIISVFDIGLNQSFEPFFTMELKTGISLAKLIAKNMKYEIGSMKPKVAGQMADSSSFIPHTSYLRNSVKQLLEIYIKVCDAVAYAHSKRVLHLDLKPENIQVGHYGEVVVCDWGLGKLLCETDNTVNEEADEDETEPTLLNRVLLNNMTMNDEVKGTPGYMGPELFLKEGKKSVTTDIYALGALLYKMLTNHLPISNISDLDAVEEQTIHGEISPPSKRFSNLNLPHALSAVIMKALACDPHDRYQSVDILRDEIHSFINGYSTEAQNAGIVTEACLFYKRNRSVCITSLAFIIIFLISIGVFFSNLRESREQAVAEKTRAERVLELYKQEKTANEVIKELYEQEKTAREEIIHEVYPSLQKEIYNLTDNLSFQDTPKSLKDAVAHLTQIIKNAPENKWAYMQRGYTYALMQQFNKANADFEKNSDTAEYLYDLSRKYAEKKPDNELLSTQDLVNFIGEEKLSGHHLAKVIIFVRYDASRRSSLADRAQIVKALLKHKNPHWKQEQFKYNHKTKYLSLEGSSLTRLIQKNTKLHYKERDEYSLQLLQTIPIDALSIKHTEIFDLNELQGLNLKYLAIHNTLITDLSSLIKVVPNLRKLALNSKQAESFNFKKHFPDLQLTIFD